MYMRTLLIIVAFAVSGCASDLRDPSCNQAISLGSERFCSNVLYRREL